MFCLHISEHFEVKSLTLFTVSLTFEALFKKKVLFFQEKKSAIYIMIYVIIKIAITTIVYCVFICI